MTTATDIGSGALRLISSLAPGEGIPGLESDTVLSALNMLLASFSAQNLMAPYRTLESFTLTAGQASYTIGQSGSPNFSTVRPDSITNVFRRDSSGQDTPLWAWTKEQYNAAPNKSVAGSPDWYYYDAQYPNGILYLYAPPDKAETLFVESLKPVAQFSSLAADMALPGEYALALTHLLAEQLAPQYGMPISPDLRKLITDAKAMIRRKNVKPFVAAVDPALLPASARDITLF